MKQQRRELKVRMKGEDVALLQKELCRNGFLIPESELSTSTFGKGTLAAVLDFQKQHKLKATGVVDAATSRRIYSSRTKARRVITAARFMVHGYVRDESGKPVMDLLVHAVDRDMRGENDLGEARTNADGYYRIEYAEKQFRRSPKEKGGPDLIVRAIDASGAIMAASRQIKNAGKSTDGKSTEVNLTVPLKLPSPVTTFAVRGTVRFGDGQPATGLRVLAYDKDLRSEQLLGETTTDGAGHYEILYSQRQFRRAGKSFANLRISVLSEDGRQAVASPVIFGARSEEQVDLVLGPEYRGPSEYEQLVAQLTPLLHGVSLAELTEDDRHRDISFLAGETGLNPQRIAFLVQAHRLMEETKVPAEVYYGLFRQGLPARLPKLLVQSCDMQRRALVSAARDNTIPAEFEDRADQTLKDFKSLIVRQALAKSTKNARMAVLGTVLKTRRQQEGFVSTYINHTGSMQEFWGGLKSSPTFRDRADDLQMAMGLAAITGNHLPLIQALQSMMENQQLKSLRDLAQFDEQTWINLITTGIGEGSIGIPDGVPGSNEAEKLHNYVGAMMNLVEDMFPTAFIAHREVGEVRTFLLNNASFNIARTRLESYLARTPRAFGEIPPENQAAVSQRIKTVQRLYRVAPRLEMANVLREAGFSSAYSIVRLPQTAFVFQYGEALGGKHKARHIYENARQIHAIGLNLLFHHGLASQRMPMNAVPDTTVERVEDIPDWQTLFGSLNLCECKHCRSVYSPAAYLVDLLDFLGERKLVAPSTIVRDARGQIIDLEYVKKEGTSLDKTARDVLFERRTDLGEIELTCENTNTRIPYIDLVNEILEDFVAPFAPFRLPDGQDVHLDNRIVSDALRLAFTPSLSSDAKISVRQQGEWWTISDSPFTYTIRRQTDGHIEVTARDRQSAGTSEELTVNPQYVNKDAYEKLVRKKHPWTMPFYIWDEEARLYLEHLGVARHEIMRAFPLDLASTSPTEAEAFIALDYLGYSIVEYMNTVPTGWMGRPIDFWEEWGFTREGQDPDYTFRIPDPADRLHDLAGPDWLEQIQRVDVFLQQSGLQYKELLDLVGSYWINPREGSGRKITIQAASGQPQDTGELKHLRLVGLDESTAIKIPRFVRLWRKLGWSMRDLDRAFTAFRWERRDDPAALDMDFLVQLSNVKRLHTNLKVPVERLLVSWALIDAATYIDHRASGQPTLPSLYARLFRNKSVINPLDPAFTEDPANLEDKLSAHASSIAAALGLSAEEFSLLFNDAHVIPHKPADSNEPDDDLTLDYLSRLFRHTVMARALKLPISEYLSLLALYGEDPFFEPGATVLFTERVDQIRKSGFTIQELDYLLRHTLTAVTEMASTDEAIARVLGNLRAGLQSIAVETTFREDPSDPLGPTVDLNGDLTRAKLALLNWDSTLIEQLIATFNDAITYRAHLVALPPDIVLPNDQGHYESALDSLPRSFVFPDAVKDIVRYDYDGQKLEASRFLTQPERELLVDAYTGLEYQKALQILFQQQDGLQGNISYDHESQTLYFSGVMTLLRRARLLSVSGDSAYQEAINVLFDAPRRFIHRNLRTFSVPDFSETLPELPKDVRFPAGLQSKIYFDAAAQRLHFRGAMTETERDLLLDLAADEDDVNYKAYQAAVRNLYTAPNDLVPVPDDTFLTLTDDCNDSSTLFDDPTTPAARFGLLLRRLFPHLQAMLSRQLVIRIMSEAFRLDTQITEKLLMAWIDCPAHAGLKAMDTYLADIFVQSNANTSIDPNIFGDQFDMYRLLHKIALVISTLELTFTQLHWLLESDPPTDWPDLNQLPLVQSNPAGTVLSAWARLWRLCQLRDRLPQGEDLLDELFTLAKSVQASASDDEKDRVKAEIFDLLQTKLGWGEDDLQTLVGARESHASGGILNVIFPDDFRSEGLLWQLLDCFALLKRMGMSAARCSSLSNPITNEEMVRNLTQAVRAKYDEKQWLEVAGPWRNRLREKQRAALAAYLLTRPDRNHLWRDMNDVYAYFLIDPEMSACQTTSRIKQAISSVQLFVQRCLMNLEPQVLASAEVDEDWRQWKWMKNYRVWEANRKVFLYPENWIEPELRNDKSPFFKELEGDLLQSDLTKESAQKALQHYLEKLDEVSRLEIVGMYHEEEALPGGKAIDNLHVFGRTPATPHICYYRRRVGSAYWTPWERIDLDIESDQLIPVVLNSRLYLIWPIFTQKPRSTDDSSHEPEKYWEIQLAWSEYINHQWSAKKVSDDFWNGEVVPWLTAVRTDFHFKSYRGENDLVMHMYLYGYHFANFIFQPGVNGPMVAALESPNEPTLPVFPGFHTQSMLLVPDTGTGKLDLPKNGTWSTALLVISAGSKLLLPHQGEDLRAQTKRPFFFQDEARTFLVTSRGIIYVPPEDGTIDPVWIDYVLAQYLGPLGEPSWDTINPAGHINPAATVGDPLIAEQSYPILSNAVRATESAATMRMMNFMATGGNFLAKEVMSLSERQVTSTVADNEVAAGLNERPDYSQEDTDDFDQITLAGLRQYRFHNFYHPNQATFMRHLGRDGVDGLLQRPIQMNSSESFRETYWPELVKPPLVEEPYPVEDVDFEDHGAYSQYNWELFFHAPLLIADRLSKNQRFEEAQRWFHFIFDPTDVSSLSVPQRYWRTKPFYETSNIQYQAEMIPNLMRYLADPNNEAWYAGLDQERRDYIKSFIEKLPGMVEKWRENPFMPHLVARMRTTAYQKTVVMKYIDNLIAWGDQLFRRDTIESINEAAQLYILAADILGKLPLQIPPRVLPQVQTFNTLPQPDDFSNALVQIEEFVPPSAVSNAISTSPNPALTLPRMLYFGVPRNDKLLEYWDTVARRLFNIRHCLNIEGVARQLPLFEPPIEPGLLVRAAAAGIDISSALNDVNALLPHYRFSVMAQKASELCAELKSLGSVLLSALEKRDAEELALLRAGQETGLLKLVEQVRKDQHDEAVQNLSALRKSREVVIARYLHYQKLLGVQSPSIPKEGQPIAEVAPSQHVSIQGEDGIKMIPHEKDEMDHLEGATIMQYHASAADILAQIQYQLPMIKSAYLGVGVQFDTARVASALASFFRALATNQSYKSSRSAKHGQFVLRSHDWALQSNLAAKEIMQIDNQILAGEIRKGIASLELENHRKQIDNARAVEEYMHDKYTNQELYSWMAGRISAMYFQAYQLAYDVAKRAERAYRHELGLKDSNFIQFGYWDNLRKGLLAGDQLFQDIKRMEVAYLDQNKREYEITKHISLVQLDPMALAQLKETGECFISIPEALFDLDYPGHYMRRIKSVGVTIPCVTGPYTGIPSTLTLTGSSVRSSNSPVPQYVRDPENDSRFTDSIGAIQSIVTSSGQNDSGLFEANLRDERYLPFEGAGVISRWHIELPSSFRPFDYNTISDVVMHVRYTARDGGEALTQLAVAELQDAINTRAGRGLARLFSIREEFPNQWYRFLHPMDSATNQILQLDITAEKFPFQFKDRHVEMRSLHLFLRPKAGFRYDDMQPLRFNLNKEQGAEFSDQEFKIAGSPIKELPYVQPFHDGSESPGTWLLEVNREGVDASANIPEMLRLKDEAGNDIVVTIDTKTYYQLNPDAVDDLILVCQYLISA